MKNRIELCCHTKMSKLQGLNDVKEYLEEAIKRGCKSIAITDTDSTQSFVEANEYLSLYTSNKDFKVIYGAEMHFKASKESKQLYTIYIYVKEQNGLKNLYELVSKAYRNIVKGKPVLYKKDLINSRDGLLYAAIGNQSEIYQCISNSNINKIVDFYDFIGIEPNESSKNINIKISKLCKKTSKLLIGTSECNFINKDDFQCNEILNLYKKVPDIKKGNNKYFQTTDELLNCFNYIENPKAIVIDNPIKVAEQIENINIISQEISHPKIESADTIILNKCYNKAHEIYGEKLPKDIEKRLQLELNSIETNNFGSIYLIFSDLVQYSNKLGYEVGNRGSIGNSFVAYLLGITKINPLEYNLPFEFLAGKNYDKEPDIVLNFSEKIRDKIFKYLQDKFGKDKVIWCGSIESIDEESISKCLKEYKSTFELKTEETDKKIINMLSGIKKVTGEHSGGVFIIPENLDILNLTPTEIGVNGHLKTHIDYHHIWHSGLYKFDIILNDEETMLHELQKATNIKSTDINLDDEETIKLFLHANDKSYKDSINGIPKFDTELVKNIIAVSKPRNFNDLVCIYALASGTDTWNYNVISLIKEEGKKLNEIISNREDVYNYLISKNIKKDIAFNITEFIGKGKAKATQNSNQDIGNKYKKWEEYKQIMKEHNISEKYIHSAEKIRYIFPKSHAIGYTMNAFKIAWYKVHYPKAFYEVYLKINDHQDK